MHFGKTVIHKHVPFIIVINLIALSSPIPPFPSWNYKENISFFSKQSPTNIGYHQTYKQHKPLDMLLWHESSPILTNNNFSVIHMHLCVQKKSKKKLLLNWLKNHQIAQTSTHMWMITPPCTNNPFLLYQH